MHVSMKITKLILVLIVIVAGLDVSAAAAQISRTTRRVAPRTVVLNLYSQHRRQSPFFQTRSRVLLDRYFTKELADLIWQEARSSRGEVGALGADPLFNAQDTRVRNFAVRERSAGPGTAEVVVSFENFGQKEQIVFQLAPAGMGWKISDIVYGDNSTLSGMLKSHLASMQEDLDVKIFLVALNDNGKTGKKIGCDDSVIPVTRTIGKTAAPLTAAIKELLTTPQHPAGNPKLDNFWRGRNLRVVSVSVLNNTATIRLAGEVFVAGICDIPRIESQIEETARQFPNVKRVRVFIGRQTLRDAIR